MTKPTRKTWTKLDTLFLAALLFVPGCMLGSGGLGTLDVRDLASMWNNGATLPDGHDGHAGAFGLSSLADIPLTGEALTDGKHVELFDDPAFVHLFSYVASCALSGDDAVVLEIDGVQHTFPGGVGLAPEWGDEDGSCDADCQGWVSACLLARSNAWGESVTVSLRGEHEALRLSLWEEEEYSFEEATYFGNVFEAPARLFACLPEGEDSIPRVCGDDLDTCPVTLAGHCEDVCEDGECVDPEDVVHDETITVFLSEEYVDHYYSH